MFIFLDIIICIVLIVLVIMIFCGFYSLCESNWMAIFQLSIGPGLFLFGLLCPITDGINLFLNFCLFVVSVDIIFLLICFFMLFCCMYIVWFMIPLGFIIFLNLGFDMLVLLIIHTISTFVGVILIGYCMLTSAFIYIATLSVLFFSVFTEITVLYIYYIIYSLDFTNIMSLKETALSQLYTINFFFLNFFFFFILIVIISLDTFNLPFDYVECESELVAGLITEFSGIFFVLYSLYESNHLMLSGLLVVTLCFGGLFLGINVMFFIVIFFIIPSSIFCSVRITTAYTFILIYIYFSLIIYIIWFIFINVMCISYI